MSIREIVVIGLGNPLMTDEGIGIYLISELSKKSATSGISFHDLGTCGTRVLHAIAGKSKAIFIDCAKMGEKSGVIRRFTPTEVQSKKILEQFSLHEGDLMSTLRLSQVLGECPPEIVIFGIEPNDIAPGQNLSPILAAKLDEYIDLINQELYL